MGLYWLTHPMGAAHACIAGFLTTTTSQIEAWAAHTITRIGCAVFQFILLVTIPTLAIALIQQGRGLWRNYGLVAMTAAVAGSVQKYFVHCSNINPTCVMASYALMIAIPAIAIFLSLTYRHQSDWTISIGVAAMLFSALVYSLHCWNTTTNNGGATPNGATPNEAQQSALLSKINIPPATLDLLCQTQVYILDLAHEPIDIDNYLATLAYPFSSFELKSTTADCRTMMDIPASQSHYHMVFKSSDTNAASSSRETIDIKRGKYFYVIDTMAGILCGSMTKEVEKQLADWREIWAGVNSEKRLLASLNTKPRMATEEDTLRQNDWQIIEAKAELRNKAMEAERKIRVMCKAYVQK